MSEVAQPQQQQPPQPEIQAPPATTTATTTDASPKPEPSTPGPTEATQHMTVPTSDTLADGEYAGKTVYDYKILNCYKELYDLGQHRGSVLLIANVASSSNGYTEPCYRTLVSLYKMFHLQGLEILAFPCNQFGGGEPGNADEIAESLSTQFPSLGDIEFPIMSKVDVNGDHELPLYSFLKSRIKGTLGQSSIKWNFTYFLVDRNGLPVARFGAEATQEEIATQIRALLTNETPAAPAAAEAPAVPAAPAAPAAPAPPPEIVVPAAPAVADQKAGEPASPVDQPRTTTPSENGEGAPDVRSPDSAPGLNATTPGTDTA